MKFDSKVLGDFERARSLEWLETNGLGGYSSGTVAGCHSRKYHGLLVAALLPPVGRNVLLSKLDETIVIDRPGEEPVRLELGANQYPGAIHPQGYQFLESFERDLFPVFEYVAEGVRLRKTIAAIHGEDTTLVLYEILESQTAFAIELVPLASARDFHSLSHANDAIGKHYIFDQDIFRTLNYQGGTELFISVPGSEFVDQAGWYYNFEYAEEQRRGLEFREDLFTHGKFSVSLKKGDKLGIIISTQNPAGRNPWRLFTAEQRRREKIVHEFSWNSLLRRLTFAADQFIVKRGSFQTVIAGYHWFADWGRDTMIALPGLCLATGRFKEAKQILQQFAGKVSDGMLPNRFPDGGESPEYNTIDATLWFFHAVHQYYKYTDDKPFVGAVFTILEDIVMWHYKGTRYNIKVDPEDGLLGGGQEGVQLTWMDAKVGDWVVTPRRGKPVEINALWYNALRIMEELSGVIGSSEEKKKYAAKASKVYKNFNAKFWNEAGGYLYDYLDGSVQSDELRPNQIYAVSLPYPLIEGAKAKSILKHIKDRLLTPKGLRSLAPSSRAYKSNYVGDIWSRDGSYHQGTAWSFLLGPYIDALFNTFPDEASAHSRQIIDEFSRHLDEAGIGTVSEIFDGDTPYTARGCIAQAWGVGEVLRVIVERNILTRSTTKFGA